MSHGVGTPSPWVKRWAHLLQPGSSVLDLACGSGRHVRWLAGLGHAVTAIDRDAAACSPLGEVAEVIVADVEAGSWPCEGRRFDGVLVTNYLWRPLWPRILESIAPGGLLIYETFAAGNETVGRPARPDFLLQPGELLVRCAGLRVIAYEDGFLTDPDRFVQRIVALRPDVASSSPRRVPLTEHG